MAGLLDNKVQQPTSGLLSDDIMRTLMDNSSKQFVQRIIHPDSFPRLDLGNGNYATHKMAWGEIGNGDNKQYVVFPTVVYDGKKLVDLGDSAFSNAINSGEYISFDTPEKADNFSKQYKKVWER